MKFIMLIKQEDAFCIILIKLLILKKLLVSKLLAKLIKTEEILLDAYILLLTSFTPQQEEFLVRMSGSMALKRLKTTLILISLITSLLANKNKCKFKTNQIKLFFKVIPLVNTLKIKKQLNKNMDLTFIKVVLFLEIL